MIKVTVSYIDDHFASLEAKGHAESAPYGEDLVCAAISAIILGGYNALEGGNDEYEAEAKQGYSKLLSKTRGISEHDETVIKTIVTQIESVASSYPKNVTLERKNKHEVHH